MSKSVDGSSEAHNAWSHLKSINLKKLTDLLNHFGPLNIPPHYDADPTLGLIKIIIGQQLSNQSAKSIWLRLNESYPERDLLISALASGRGDVLRISRAKARTISGILNDKQINLQNLIHKNQKYRMKYLCQYWGIGPWTAEMWGMFICRDPNIWSNGDLILKKIIKNLVSDSRMTELDLIDASAPFKTYLAIYCWRSSD